MPLLNMLQHISQPPINPALRNPERHYFWPGFVAVVAGVVLTVCGARHLTTVDTIDGSSASEIQLVKAFSSGGLQYPEQVPPPPPPKPDGSANSAEALDRWARQQANTPPPAWKVRVDASAKTPCPT